MLYSGEKFITESKIHNRYFMRLSPVGRRSEYKFYFLDQDVICAGISRVTKGPLLKELKRHKIWISDVGDDHSEIDILIGSDIYGKILTGEAIQLEGGLTAVNTKLGWTLCGEQNGPQAFSKAVEDQLDHEPKEASTLCANLAIHDLNISDLWSFETIGISDAVSKLN